MIQKNVVLILGAGASQPFGLPLGKGLLSMILNVDEKTDEFRFLMNSGFDAMKINEFRSELRLAGRTSVDAFLETNEEFMDVGKAMISLLLANCEKGQKLYSPETEENWYQYLLEIVIRGAPPTEMDWSELSFVTYNYDRSLEFYLFNAIKRLVPVPDRNFSSVSALFSRIRILHIHGLIDNPKLSSELEGRGYGKIKSEEDLRRSMRSITIIHEKEKSTSSYPMVHALLSEAESIVFLGFGYHPTNMSRLEVVHHKRPDATVYGSTLGMTDSEVMFHLHRELPGNYEHKTTLGLLRDQLEIFYRT